MKSKVEKKNSYVGKRRRRSSNENEEEEDHQLVIRSTAATAGGSHHLQNSAPSRKPRSDSLKIYSRNLSGSLSDSLKIYSPVISDSLNGHYYRYSKKRVLVPEEVKGFHEKVMRTPNGGGRKAIALSTPQTAMEKSFAWPNRQPNKHLRFAYEYREYNDPFTINNRVLSTQAPRTPYRRRHSDGKSVIHWGQRKLLFSEIEFLTLYGHLSKTVVYAGAAPGSHITKLCALFPQHKFILYDPNDFDPKLKNPRYDKKIVLKQEYFMDETAKSFSDEGVLFISDIRTANWQKMTEEDVQKRVKEDNKWMKDWVLLMKPKKAMLKFKVPYPEKPKSLKEIHSWLSNRGVSDKILRVLKSHNISPVKLRSLTRDDLNQFNELSLSSSSSSDEEKNQFLKNIEELRTIGCTYFLKGDIHLPIWGPVTTTETRLVTDADQPLVLYDHTDYEEQMFHFNTITRMTYYPHEIETSPQTGYDHCYDCRAEIWVLEQYLKLCQNIGELKMKEEIVAESRDISHILNHDLYTYVHRVYDDDKDS